MRPLHSLLVALALALACVLGWFLIRSSATRVDVASAAPAGSTVGGNSSDAGPASLATPGPAAPAGAGERSVREVAPEPVAQAQDGRSQRAQGQRVVGRVVDEAGEALAGARVYAASGSGDLAVFGDLPLDARGAESWDWLRRVETRSGADGRFELAGLRAGSLRVAVRQAGFAPYDEESTIPAEESVDLGDLRLSPGVVVSGRVVDARGKPVANADVLRLAHAPQAMLLGGFGAGGATPVATTRMDGSFVVDELAVGPWALRVESQQHPHALVDGTTSAVGERIEGLIVTLEEGEEIHGLVRDVPPGESLAVRALPRGPAPDAARVAELTPPSTAEARQADVAADGTFRLLGLRRGQHYELALTRKGRRGPFGFMWSPSLATPVRARAGERGVELVYQAESALVFQALDALSGEPIEQFRVEAGIDWPLPQVDEDGSPVVLRPGGRARVGNLRPRSSSDKASLRIAAVGYAPYSADDLALVVGQDNDLGPIFLEPLPLLSVRVLDDATGAPVEGASVTLSEVEPARRGGFGQRRVEIDFDGGAESDGGDGLLLPGDRSQRARTDAEGVARVTLPVGTSCRLTVRHAEHAPWRSEVFPAPKAAAEREVRLGQGGRVVARLRGPDGEPVAGGRIEHQSPGAEGSFAVALPGGPGGQAQVTNTAGEVAYEHLEPGTHRFRRAKASGGGFFTDGGAMVVRMSGMPGEDRGWVEVLVAEGGESEVELVAPPEVAVEGRVREAGELLAGATVELSPRESGAEPRLPFLGGGGPRAETDGQGRFRLEGVEPGDYTMTVRHATRAMPAELELRVGEVDMRKDVDLSVAIIEGRVTDEAGKSLAGVRVWPERARPEGTAQMLRVMAFATNDGGGSVVSLDDGGFASVQARTDADGRYQLRGVAPDVELQVRAEGDGVQPARSDELRVAHDEVRRGVDLVLATAGRIEVIALRSDGSPARNVLLTLQPEEDAQGEQRTEFVGEEGRVVVDSLGPGTWRVTARTIGPEEGDPIPEQTVLVVAGETAQATFTIP